MFFRHRDSFLHNSVFPIPLHMTQKVKERGGEICVLRKMYLDFFHDLNVQFLPSWDTLVVNCIYYYFSASLSTYIPIILVPCTLYSVLWTLSSGQCCIVLYSLYILLVQHTTRNVIFDKNVGFHEWLIYSKSRINCCVDESRKSYIKVETIPFEIFCVHFLPYDLPVC
jgi:hypothetical protein